MNSFLSLVDAEKNEEYVIFMVEDDCSPVLRRLGDLGFFPEAHVVLLKKSMLNKSVLISLDGTKLMLRSTLAAKIIVKKVGK